MFESLASLLRRAPVPESPAADKAPKGPAPIAEEAHQELAMTDELREALFPRQPKMVSTIFDRPAGSHIPLVNSHASQTATTSSSSAGRDCLFL